MEFAIYDICLNVLSIVPHSVTGHPQNKTYGHPLYNNEGKYTFHLKFLHNYIRLLEKLKYLLRQTFFWVLTNQRKHLPLSTQIPFLTHFQSRPQRVEAETQTEEAGGEPPAVHDQVTRHSGRIPPFVNSKLLEHTIVSKYVTTYINTCHRLRYTYSTQIIRPEPLTHLLAPYLMRLPHSS